MISFTRHLSDLKALTAIAVVVSASIGAVAMAGTPSDREGGGAVIRGVDRGGITFGVISDITATNIAVNGASFNVSGAVITAGNQPVTLDQLGQGQIVALNATAGTSNPVASSVRFDASVAGPVTSITHTNQEMIALGQRVSVDAGTLFGATVSPASLSGLAPGDNVVVSGHRDVSGAIRATRIDIAGPLTSMSVLGVVAEVNQPNTLLRVEQQWINYGNALIEGFASGLPAISSTILATGNPSFEGDEWSVQFISRHEPLQGLTGTSLSLEGLVTALNTSSSFTVGAVPVLTTAQTAFDGGVAADLALDARLEVSGSTDSQGTLIADTVEYRPNGEIRISAMVSGVDSKRQSLQVLGIKLFADEHTIYKDDSGAEIQSLGLAQIVTGDYLDLRAYLDETTGQILATKVERLDPRNETELQGYLRSLDTATRTVNVQGITVSTDPANSDLDEFFERADIGELVCLTGNQTGTGHVAADTLEVVDDDSTGQLADIEMEGLITYLASPAFFRSGNIGILANSQTEFANGSASDLATGVVVKIEGRVINAGLVVATGIDFAVD